MQLCSCRLLNTALESLPADLQQNFTRMRETDLKVQSKLARKRGKAEYKTLANGP